MVNEDTFGLPWEKGALVKVYQRNITTRCVCLHVSIPGMGVPKKCIHILKDAIEVELHYGSNM